MRVTRFLGAAFGAAVFLCAGSVSAAPAHLIQVLITPGVMSEATESGNVDVTMTVPAMEVPAGEPIVSLSVMAPGMRTPQAVSDLILTDALGPAPLVADRGDGEDRWCSTRAVKGDVVVHYRLPIQNTPPLSGGPPINLRIDGDGFSGAGSMLLMQPKVSSPYRIAIRWDVSAMGPGTEGVTSYGDGDVELSTGSVQRLDETFFMAGHPKRYTPTPEGAFSAVWLGDPGFDPRPAMQWTGELHKWMSRFFKDKAEPPYRVFLRFNPMNAGGGAAFTHSFLVTYGAGVTGDSLQSILGHEMVHTWTENDLGKWYNEGNAVHYQALLSWRGRLISTDAFLRDLNLTASRYYTNPLIGTPDDQILSRFWQDTRIRVLPYDRGAMYFAVLDGMIRRASGGKRSVDDLIQVVIERGWAGEPITDAVWVDLLRKEVGAEGPAVHGSMMAGGLMLPQSDDFGPCFRRVTMKIRQFELGFDPLSLIGPNRRIRGLMANSEAAKAALRDGDVVSYGVSLDQVQAEVSRTLTLQVTRDGKTFPITYLPRGEAVDAYQWERIPSVPDSACR
jgi:hypothetical protein